MHIVTDMLPSQGFASIANNLWSNSISYQNLPVQYNLYI